MSKVLVRGSPFAAEGLSGASRGSPVNGGSQMILAARTNSAHVGSKYQAS